MNNNVSNNENPAFDKKTSIYKTHPLFKPVYLKGEVIKGYGRGSKLLGIPTANLPADKYKQELQDIDTGVYLGWANVNNGPVYKTVLSIGNNPYFKNKTKTIEPHLLHTFENDFYGAELKLIILGFIRMNTTFSGLDELIKAIKNDIEIGKVALEDPRYKKYETDPFFKE